ncbi:hypothetical protein DYB30_005761 [Aphanomyces astaci]|uniref:Uncharacterized protein n=1 Tax=Aphanomyces astaci TaxID=112090 RepID=A0A397F1L2_APHAT|nr:hypothetical protein DYB34_010629 [Aphanomyces astaci]RHY69848.1 hypothetical protein DYB30_005761 [Aphanomyces astaci]RHZ05372.1 hypothetical protein DYB31_011387 [Aphanomyces astaci]RHZ42211.1 hypothetical protein DYB26_001166 [Aphanomyces astaci]
MNSPITRASSSSKSLKRQTSSAMSPTKRARLVGNLTISVSANLLNRSDEYRGRCKYKSGRCPNERTIKFSGEPHTLCEEHRVKHNKNQRKSDAKRRGVVKVKRDGTVVYEDDDDACPVYMKKEQPSLERTTVVVKPEPTIKSEPSQDTTSMWTLQTRDSDPLDIEEIDMSETSSCWSEDEVEILKNIFDFDMTL